MESWIILANLLCDAVGETFEGVASERYRREAGSKFGKRKQGVEAKLGRKCRPRLITERIASRRKGITYIISTVGHSRYQNSVGPDPINPIYH